ncbi:hypothetical protein N7510_005718 [Penicillium lagena]|uniref:uncharacterized protein n=1 Tax=Penicillium lagena TaxID=94218 RepID=UPI00253F97EE|nr:uncharacterized protein N7510_005718 [Penicillium lagena]KAJ5612524.1 hypothetical protein N7510_005718 [Penicillium lagena]
MHTSRTRTTQRVTTRYQNWSWRGTRQPDGVRVPASGCLQRLWRRLVDEALICAGGPTNEHAAAKESGFTYLQA